MTVLNKLPLDHLDRLTDSTGLIQHAIYSIPRRDSGYTTDDNARALRLCARLWRHRREGEAPAEPGLAVPYRTGEAPAEPSIANRYGSAGASPSQPVSPAQDRLLERIIGYLGFLEFARCPGRGFHNFLSYQRTWLDREGCGDCQGQAVRALAEVLGSDLPEDHRDLARELIDAVTPALADLRSLRAQAYVVLAWGHLWEAGVAKMEPLESVAWFAAKRLAESFDRAQRTDWPWFESRLTYANAVLPHALFVAARRWPDEPFLKIAAGSFAFLDQQTTLNGVFSPIGNAGWHPRGAERAQYDQQPVEADTMAEAALAAFKFLGDSQHLETFRRASGWFHGQNSLGLPLADVNTGGCCDGLQASGVNRNQGAESTLAYLSVELQNLEVQQSAGSQLAPATLRA